MPCGTSESRKQILLMKQGPFCKQCQNLRGKFSCHKSKR